MRWWWYGKNFDWEPTDVWNPKLPLTWLRSHGQVIPSLSGPQFFPSVKWEYWSGWLLRALPALTLWLHRLVLWAVWLQSVGQLTLHFSVPGLMRDADLIFGFALWFVREAVLPEDDDKGSSAAFHRGKKFEGIWDNPSPPRLPPNASFQPPEIPPLCVGMCKRGSWTQFQCIGLVWGSFPTPTSNSQTPAECPEMQLNSDTTFSETESDSTGKGLSHTRPPSTADTSLKARLLPDQPALNQRFPWCPPWVWSTC